MGHTNDRFCNGNRPANMHQGDINKYRRRQVSSIANQIDFTDGVLGMIVCLSSLSTDKLHITSVFQSASLVNLAQFDQNIYEFPNISNIQFSSSNLTSKHNSANIKITFGNHIPFSWRLIMSEENNIFSPNSPMNISRETSARCRV